MIYDYRCHNCDKVYTLARHHTEIDNPEDCPGCNSQMVRQFTPSRNIIGFHTKNVEPHFNYGLGAKITKRQDLVEAKAKLRGEYGIDAVEVGNDKKSLQSIKRKKVPLDIPIDESAYKEPE